MPSSSCGAPGTVQPSIGSPSSSNDVLPSPVETTMSSMNTPGNCWRPQSLSDVIETSTCVPAYAERSTWNCCQPPELPFAAFHVAGRAGRAARARGRVERLVVGQERVQHVGRVGRVAPAARAGLVVARSLDVWPLRSGSVVQSSWPTVCASTIM